MNILHQTQMRSITLPHPLPYFLLLPCLPLLLPAVQPFQSLGATRPRELAQLGRLLAPHREFPEKLAFYLSRLDRDFQVPGWRRENNTVEPCLRRDCRIR